MIRCCRTCAFFVHQVIEDRVYLDGRCIHIAFIRAGMSKRTSEGEQVLLNKDINSITDEEIFEANIQGYLFYDFVKILGHRVKVCDHWMSQLSFANIVFKYYKDDIKNYGGFKGGFEKWFIKGCPLESKKFKCIEKKQKVNRMFEIKEVPEIYLNYESCAMCESFKYEIKDRTIEPFKGRCLVNEKNRGNLRVFKNSKNGGGCTYSFLGCKRHKSMSVNVFEMVDRLKYFVGINPIRYKINEIKNIYKHPFITQERRMDVKNIKKVKLDKLLLSKYDFKKWEEFKELENFKIIREFFRDNLKKCKNVKSKYVDSDKLFE